MSQPRPQFEQIMNTGKALAAILLSLAPVLGHAAAYYNVGAWYKTQYNRLQITSSAQSVYTDNCSGTVTVQSQNPFGAVKNVSSNLTVSLSAPAGVTFYSDSACTSSISSVTITSGNSTANFYFIDTSAGSVTITAAAAPYVSALQTETLSANPFVWTGAGGNALWSTAANWSGGVAPGSSNVALFKGSACSTNCSPTISSSINVNGIRMNLDYTGTITQSSGYTVTVGMGGWVQLAGNFVGSSSGDAISVGDSNLIINGGAFTSTSGTLTFGDRNAYYSLTLTVGSGATFNHNGGTFMMQAPCANQYLSTGTATFKHVTLGGACSTYNFNNGTMNIAGNLTIQNISYGGTFNSGTLAVAGDVSVTGPNGNNGSMVIQLTGNAAGQTVSAPSSGVIPNLTIAAGTNPVTLSGAVTVAGNYIVSSVGAFTSTGSTLTISGNCTNYTITPGTVTYNNVAIGGSCPNYSLGGGTMTVAGNLNFNNTGYGGNINTGTFAVGGNVTVTGPNYLNGNVVIQLTGNAAGQTVSAPSSGVIPNLTIAAGTNPVTLSGTLPLSGSYIVSSVGTLTTTGSTLVFNAAGSSANVTLTPGSATYNNVTFAGYNPTYNLGGGTLSIAGNLSLNVSSYGGAINSGTLAVSGNFTAASGSNFNGNVAFQFVGTGTQTITSGASTLPSGAVTINNASGSVVLASNFAQSGNWTLTAGTIYMSGYNLTTSGFSLNGNTIHRKNSGATTAAGILTVNGTTYGNGSALGGTVAD